VKKFLLTLAVLAMGTPAWAVTIADWSSTPIVSGDKTFTLNSTNITDTNVTVNVQDLGVAHQLNLANLAGITSTANFSLNFTVTVNSGPNTITGANVTQNPFLTGLPVTTTDWATGAFSDTLTGSQTGTVHPFSTTSLIVDTTASTLDGSNRLSNLTYSFVQTAPVPEPSTFVLCGLGLVGLVAARRRR